MRKILISPGYGAGFVTWASDHELKKFMLEYKPFIDHLENGGDFRQRDGLPLNDVHWDGDGTPDFNTMQKEMSEIVFTFVRECWDKFGTIPYLGGLEQLKVVEVSGPVKLEEYDGHETCITKDEEEYM